MRKLLALLLLPYGLWLSFAYQYHFVDGANLLFHEAGHLILRPFGDWLQFLGGTLGQLAFPIAAFIHFQRQQQRFEAGVCALWGGENLMNIAHYMADAKLQQLPLVGGGIHDWGWMFGRLDWLNAAEGIGASLHLLASLLVLGCCLYLLKLAFAPLSD